MSAAAILREVIAGRPGWTLDKGSGLGYASASHTCGAVVELFAPRPPETGWRAEAGHPPATELAEAPDSYHAVSAAVRKAVARRPCEHLAELVGARPWTHPLSPEASAARAPLPPDVLLGALHAPVGPASGRLIRAQPVDTLKGGR